MPKNLSLKLIHICTDDQGTFWLDFAFCFSSCYNSRIHYRNLECRNKTVWLFNRDQNFRGNNFTRNPTVGLRINDFQDSKVSTSFLWRHNHRKFSDGSRNNYMQEIAGPESAFGVPLFPTHSSHLCCHERAGWGGRQNWVCPRARETLGMPLQWWPINPNDIHSATLTLCTCAKYIGEQSLFGNALLGLKTRLRSTMSQGWLNNVMACHTQRERLKLLKSEKNVEKFVAVSEHRRQVFRYF